MELHARMHETAAALGPEFGRGGGKHTQDVFSLRFGDKSHAALGLPHFMGVDPGLVYAGMYEGAAPWRGVTLNPKP